MAFATSLILPLPNSSISSLYWLSNTYHIYLSFFIICLAYNNLTFFNCFIHPSDLRLLLPVITTLQSWFGSFFDEQVRKCGKVSVEIWRFLVLKRGWGMGVEISSARCLKIQFLSKLVHSKWRGVSQNMRYKHAESRSDFKNKQMNEGLISLQIH